MKPPELKTTPFKLVEEVRDLKEMAAKLRAVNEFAVRFNLFILGSISLCGTSVFLTFLYCFVG